MDPQDLEQNIEKEFHVSRYIIVYKFILGLIEVIVGLGLLFFGSNIFALYRQYKVKELVEDPHDLLVTIMEKLLPIFFAHRQYIIFFLVVIGLIKMMGAVGLFFKKHWGLDLLIAVTLFLLPFDTYNLLLKPTPAKAVYVIINIFIALYLVNFKPKEYVHRLRHRIRRKTYHHSPLPHESSEKTV